MYIRDLVPKGAMVTPKLPSYGIYQNVLLTDKRRGIFPAAVGPQAKLDVTGDTEKFVLLQGMAPAMYVPGGKDTVSGYMNDCDKLLDSIVEEIDWQWAKYDPAMRQAMLPDTAWKKRSDKGELWCANDSMMMYQMFPTLDFIWFMNKLQQKIAHDMYVPAIAFAEPIGLSALIDPPVQGSKAKSHQQLLRPKKTVNIRGSIQFEMHVPQETIIMRLRREISKWQCMVAAAARDVAMACAYKFGPRLEDKDFLAWAAYTIGAYSGFNDAVDDVVKYTSEDVYQDTYSYLGLPFSDTWPDIALDPDMMDQTGPRELQKKLFMLNTLLAVAGKRIGGKMIPVQYHYKRGQVLVIKQMLKEYVNKSPLEMDGSNNLWMQPALNTNIPFGVLFPGPIVDGDCEWAANVPDKNETFTDAMVDRAEITLANLDDMNSNYRVVTSRDSRVRLVSEHGNEYFTIYTRLQADHKRRGPLPDGTELLMSYLADPTLKFTGAVYLSAAFLRPTFGFTLGPTPVIDTKIMGMEHRIPVPGGIVDVDMGTVHALASAQTPKTGGAAAALSGDGPGTVIAPVVRDSIDTGVVTAKELEAQKK